MIIANGSRENSGRGLPLTGPFFFDYDAYYTLMMSAYDPAN